MLGTRKLPEAETNFTLPDPSAVSFYQQWIQRDLQPWRVEGISTVSLSSQGTLTIDVVMLDLQQLLLNSCHS